jgi:hypothetical protein
MPSEPFFYQMRGHHVSAVKETEILAVAKKVCEIIGIKRNSFSRSKPEKLVSRLEHYGIHVDPIADHTWLDATRATVDPQTGMIYMPERLYLDLCEGQPEAIRIFLHELGHIFLCHKPMLHFSEAQPKKEHDSEWQADYFADSIIQMLGLKSNGRQIEFKF